MDSSNDDWIRSELIDPQAILSEARTDSASGRYAEALRKLEWFFSRALEYDPHLNPVRLSFALGYWHQLSRVFPPAHSALIKQRDTARHAMQAACEELACQGIQESTSNAAFRKSFQEFEAINHCLGQDSTTLSYFLDLDRYRPEFAELVFSIAQGRLIEAEEFEICLKYLESPSALPKNDAYLTHIRTMVTDGRFPDEQIRVMEELFTTNIATLAALLVKVNCSQEASKIVSNAKRELRDSHFHGMLDDALEGRFPETGR